MNKENEITGPLADVFVSEEEYKKQMQNQEEDETENEIESIAPSQIFSSTFYKLNKEQQKKKLLEYLAKPHTLGVNIETEITVKHREKCRAVKNSEEGTWPSPWSFVKAERLDYDEKKDEWKDNIETKFEEDDIKLLLKCNDSECSARLKVDAADLLGFISSVVRQEK